MLLGGEAHIVDLPRELQKEATGRGMKLLSSTHPVDWISIYFGGQYYLPGDPKFKADVPWTNKKVRQAMNMAVNRQELLDTIFAGKATPAYLSGWLPISEGWNPEWATRFDQLYGYNPAKAKELLKEAGYPDGALKVKVVAFTNPGESEGPLVAEALAVYFQDVGIDATLETLDPAKVRDMTRSKNTHCCIWPNIVGWRPAEERIRAHTSQGVGSQFSERVHRKALSGPDAERRLWREATDRPGDRRSSLRRIFRHPALLALQRSGRQSQSGGRVDVPRPWGRPLDALPPAEGGEVE